MIFWLASLTLSLIPVAKQYPGFSFGSKNAQIQIDLYVDLICPDCATIWSIVKQVMDKYKTQVHVQMHCYDLCYHKWAYLVARGLYALNAISEEKAKMMIDGLFINHDQTQFAVPESEKNMTDTLVNYVTTTYEVEKTDFMDKFASSDVVTNTRVDYKYSQIKGLHGTPTVYINGGSSSLNETSTFEDWTTEIDSLLT